MTAIVMFVIDDYLSGLFRERCVFLWDLYSHFNVSHEYVLLLFIPAGVVMSSHVMYM